MSEATILHRVRAVTETEVLDDASVIVVDEQIAAIEPAERVREAHGTIVDGTGSTLIPGIIDTHNDSLETEINPRPSVQLPPEFALGNFERRAVSSGVTTCFHAISFVNIESKNRTIERSKERAKLAISRGASGLIDHRVLHRCDVWTPEGVDLIFQSMLNCNIPVVSINDHMPGQGQFRDLEQYKQWIRSTRGDDAFDADAEIKQRQQQLHQDGGIVREVHAEIARRRLGTETIVVSHDDDSPEKVDMMIEIGASVAEFPINMESALRARERGMWITVGAPNVVRGASTNNNLSARQLISDGLADIICGDYHTPSLIYAAFVLNQTGHLDLPGAVRMVSGNPAAAFGLRDRGNIAPGLRADLVLVELVDGIPTVRLTMRSGDVVFRTGSGSGLSRTSVADSSEIMTNPV